MNLATKLLDSAILSLITPLEGTLGNQLRFQYYKNKLKKCGGFFSSGAGFFISEPKRISIGKHCAFNRNVMIDGSQVDIGDYALVGPNTLIQSSYHNYSNPNIPIVLQGGIHRVIRIGRGVWIGANSVVLKDTALGDGCVIAAHSLVNKSVPGYEVWGGVPARFLKKRGLK